MGDERLRDVGEDGLLARVLPRLPASPGALLGPGDDAAVVAAPDGRVVATTDVLVQDRDFRLEWSSPQDVGWKAAAQNLADVAAMGARPTALLVGLVAPADLPVAWAVGLADGLAAACAGTGAGVVGGDLSAGEAVVVSVTALGDLEGRPPVLRSGARPGDVVAVAGPLGRSAAGLDLLDAGRTDVDPSLVAAHRRPSPPYDAGPAAAGAGATAMLDVSDGLVRDAGRLARASGVRVHLDADALAPGPALLAAAAHLRPVPGAGTGQGHLPAGDGARALAWVLGGGEDHALLACLPPDVPLPAAFRTVGRVRAGEPAVVVSGQRVDDGASGWDHFA